MKSRKAKITLLYLTIFISCTLIFLILWFSSFINGFLKRIDRGFRLFSNSEVSIVPDYPDDLMHEVDIMNNPITFYVEHSDDIEIDSVCVGTQLIFFLETDRTQTYCEEDEEFFKVERSKNRDKVTLYPRKQLPIENSVLLYIQTIDSEGKFNWRIVYFATIDTLFDFILITLGYVVLVGLVCWFPFKMLVGSVMGRVPMGFVYNAVNKKAISLAVIRVFDNNDKLIMTTVTDVKGYFKIRLPKGFYKIVVNANEFIFPSKLAYPLKNIDVNYGLYYGDIIKINGENEIINVSVPMDPQNVHNNNFKLVIYKIFFTYFATNIIRMVSFFAFLSFLMLFVFGFSEQNVYEFILMIMGIVLFFIFYFTNQVKYGAFIDENGNGISGVSFDVYDSLFNQFILSTTSDENGKFVLSVPSGEYSLKLKNSNYYFNYNGDTDIFSFVIKGGAKNFFKGKIKLKKK